ncbi:Uncharacterised protein [Klebsiella pneumoniae subsp. rhinoscleromatis]|nr:Uncharacterised protein [Klebsiella pneumoniae subsp. rhinoscleromatis]
MAWLQVSISLAAVIKITEHWLVASAGSVISVTPLPSGK